ncbi:hypothetical protein BDK51DRAFT_42918 [Blyttiomyces helicus]|uniref:Uncharacterized protein n=1 Tax=Blyttiomyces helicus TaxID=388810 RepID=A0A4P9W7D1_9FUNG|nr:hypothetical protein BDK51DRAFT_42918 [Blyttiomyces helicus]|eukprot:RKO87982.1 hypothetical protein BDK51DRAFT_42918 [Blyttiomyces helicus]
MFLAQIGALFVGSLCLIVCLLFASIGDTDPFWILSWFYQVATAVSVDACMGGWVLVLVTDPARVSLLRAGRAGWKAKAVRQWASLKPVRHSQPRPPPCQLKAWHYVLPPLSRDNRIKVITQTAIRMLIFAGMLALISWRFQAISSRSGSRRLMFPASIGMYWLSTFINYSLLEFHYGASRRMLQERTAGAPRAGFVVRLASVLHESVVDTLISNAVNWASMFMLACRDLIDDAGHSVLALTVTFAWTPIRYESDVEYYMALSTPSWIGFLISFAAILASDWASSLWTIRGSRQAFAAYHKRWDDGRKSTTTRDPDAPQPPIPAISAVESVDDRVANTESGQAGGGRGLLVEEIPAVIDLQDKEKVVSSGEGVEGNLGMMSSGVGIVCRGADVEEGTMAREPEPAAPPRATAESGPTPSFVPAATPAPSPTALSASPTDPMLETFGTHALLTRYRFAAKFAAITTASAWYALFCTSDLVAAENSVGSAQIDVLVQRVGTYNDEAAVGKVLLRLTPRLAASRSFSYSWGYRPVRCSTSSSASKSAPSHPPAPTRGSGFRPSSLWVVAASARFCLSGWLGVTQHGFRSRSFSDMGVGSMFQAE